MALTRHEKFQHIIPHIQQALGKCREANTFDDEAEKFLQAIVGAVETKGRYSVRDILLKEDYLDVFDKPDFEFVTHVRGDKLSNLEWSIQDGNARRIRPWGVILAKIKGIYVICSTDESLWIVLNKDYDAFNTATGAMFSNEKVVKQIPNNGHYNVTYDKMSGTLDYTAVTDINYSKLLRPKNNIVTDVNLLLKNYFKGNRDILKVKQMFEGAGNYTTLIAGKVGTGKSHYTNVIAGDYKDDVLVANCIGFDAYYVLAKQAADAGIPTIAVLEECDQWLRGLKVNEETGDFDEQGSGFVKNFLSGSDTPRNREGFFGIFITNYPTNISKDILNRPGRIDSKFVYPTSDRKEAVTIIKKYASSFVEGDTKELDMFSDLLYDYLSSNGKYGDITPAKIINEMMQLPSIIMNWNLLKNTNVTKLSAKVLYKATKYCIAEREASIKELLKLDSDTEI